MALVMAKSQYPPFLSEPLKQSFLFCDATIICEKLQKSYCYFTAAAGTENARRDRSHPGTVSSKNLKETQRALKLAGCAELYPRIDVDAAIIICINNSIHKVADIEEFFLKNDITESPFPTVTES